MRRTRGAAAKTPTRINKQFKQVENFLQTHFTYKDAFNQLSRCWSFPYDLTGLLCRIVLFDNESEIWRKPAVRRLWASGTGKSLPTLQYFPRKLRGMAEEIERTNKRVPTYETRFDQLPMTLGDYADFLEQYFDSERDAVRINRDMSESEADSVLSALFQVVRKKMGRPMFPEVASLLTGTARKLGIFQGDEEYSADAVKVRMMRMKRTAPHAK